MFFLSCLFFNKFQSQVRILRLSSSDLPLYLDFPTILHLQSTTHQRTCNNSKSNLTSTSKWNCLIVTDMHKLIDFHKKQRHIYFYFLNTHLTSSKSVYFSTRLFHLMGVTSRWKGAVPGDCDSHWNWEKLISIWAFNQFLNSGRLSQSQGKHC